MKQDHQCLITFFHRTTPVMAFPIKIFFVNQNPSLMKLRKPSLGFNGISSSPTNYSIHAITCNIHLGQESQAWKLFLDHFPTPYLPSLLPRNDNTTPPLIHTPPFSPLLAPQGWRRWNDKWKIVLNLTFILKVIHVFVTCHSKDACNKNNMHNSPLIEPPQYAIRTIFMNLRSSNSYKKGQ